MHLKILFKTKNCSQYILETRSDKPLSVLGIYQMAPHQMVCPEGQQAFCQNNLATFPHTNQYNLLKALPMFDMLISNISEITANAGI